MSDAPKTFAQVVFEYAELAYAREWMTWLHTPMWPTDEQLESAKQKVAAMSDEAVLRFWNRCTAHTAP